MKKWASIQLEQDKRKVKMEVLFVGGRSQSVSWWEAYWSLICYYDCSCLLILEQLFFLYKVLVLFKLFLVIKVLSFFILFALFIHFNVQVLKIIFHDFLRWCQLWSILIRILLLTSILIAKYLLIIFVIIITRINLPGIGKALALICFSELSRILASLFLVVELSYIALLIFISYVYFVCIF